MNEINKKISYTVDKIMPERQFKQPNFTYINCGLIVYLVSWKDLTFQTGDIKYICKNESGNVSFSYDLLYCHSKYFAFISNDSLKGTA